MSRKNNWTSKRRLRLLPVLAAGLALLLAGWWLDGSGLNVLATEAAPRLRTVRISEVQTRNEQTLPELDGASWIELENTGDAPVSLKGLRLTRDDKLKKTLAFPNRTLEPGAFLLIAADGENDASGDILHAPFKLPNAGSHELFLYDEATDLIDRVSIAKLDTDQSYSRNDLGEWEVTAVATPGEANVIADQRVALGDVAFNEVMCANPALFPDEEGQPRDYVELINLGSEAIDLEGYCLSDSEKKPRKWAFPAVTLPAGGILAVHCSGLDRTGDVNHLHTSFKLSKGESVYLFTPDGAMTASVSIGELSKGQALSRTDGGEWTTELLPTPGLENTPEAVLALDSANQAARAGRVFISEVMASPETETSDWVELYNDGDAAVDLTGWGLSDNIKKARKWQFPAGSTIAAHGHLLLALTGTEKAPVDGLINVPFVLPVAGNFALTLCEPDGSLADCLYMPEQYYGISFGRAANGACGYFSEATPLKANGSDITLGRAPMAAYSVGGGLHEKGESFEVALASRPGARIYYTLDCSDPDEGANLYDGTPIPVSKTTILRTRVYMDGHMPSPMDTQSYLFGVKSGTEVPYVISLVSDPRNLTSSRYGIMVPGKYDNLHQEWEREAHVEIFAEGASPAVIDQECGIKLHGRNTRTFQLKSFKVMAKKKYGTKRFYYPLFKDRPYDEYEAFILRFAGQDYKYCFMRDVVETNLAANTSVMYMEAMESIVYLNGKYYSAMYVRENISPFSLARREGWTGQEDSLDLVKSDYDVKQGSDADYLALADYLRHHDANTQEVYDRIAAEVDIDNFIEYAGMYVTFCPPDTVNVKRYRNTDADGKWRWVLYDLDRGLRDDGDGFKLMATGTNGPLFRAFMRNDQLRDRFLKNLNTALATYLSSESMTGAIRDQLERIMPVLPQYLKNLDLTQSGYKSRVESFAATAAARPAQVLKHCASYLDLSDKEMQAYFADAYAAIEAYKAK